MLASPVTAASASETNRAMITVVATHMAKMAKMARNGRRAKAWAIPSRRPA
jgi:hypothetical protein